MKNLLRLSFITFLSLFVISCSGGDGDGNSSVPTDTAGSFLVEYAGVIWAATDNDSMESTWFSVSPAGFTGWDLYDGDCDVNFGEWDLVDEYGYVQSVQTNSSNTLVILVSCVEDCGDSDDYTVTLTVVDENTIRAVDSDYPDQVDYWVRDDDGGC